MSAATSIANSMRDYESLLNFIGVVKNQSAEIKKLTSHIEKDALKIAIPKLTYNADGSISAGSNKFSLDNGRLMLDNLEVPYDASKTLTENYHLIKNIVDKRVSKRTAFQLFVPEARASSGYEYLIGLGLLIWSWGEKNATWPWLAGIALIVHSCSAGAADGIIPLQTCESKNGGYRNSLQNIRNDIFTEDYQLDTNGNLAVTVKMNGDTEKVMTFARQGGKYSVLKTTDGKGNILKNDMPPELAEQSFKTFSDCSDPKTRQIRINSSKALREAVKSGDIRLAELNLKRAEDKENGNTK